MKCWRRRLVAAVLLAAGTVIPAGSRAWTVRTHEAPVKITTDSGGDVLMAVPARTRRYQGTHEVIKLDGHGGRLEWRHRVRGKGPERSDEIHALLLMSNRDVVVGGTVYQGRERNDFIVARLARRDGRERWRRILRGHVSEGGGEAAFALAVDRNDDVIAAGTLENTKTPRSYDEDFTVTKLGGGTGTEQWRFTLDGLDASDGATGVAVDAVGDVVAAGYLFGSDAAFAPVVKLRGGTGELVWRHDLDLTFGAGSIALDVAGDVYLAVGVHALGNDFAVVKLSGATGETLWIARESASDVRWEQAFHVAVDPSGAVFAAGITDCGTGFQESDGQTFTVVRLDGATGARAWIYRARGTAGGAFARDLAVIGSRIVVASGSSTNARTCADGIVVGIDALTGLASWSRTVDGSFVARRCKVEDCERPPCPAVDDDELSALAVDSRGVIFVGASVLDRDESGPRRSAFLRRLSVGR